MMPPVERSLTSASSNISGAQPRASGACRLVTAKSVQMPARGLRRQSLIGPCSRTCVGMMFRLISRLTLSSACLLSRCAGAWCVRRRSGDLQSSGWRMQNLVYPNGSSVFAPNLMRRLAWAVTAMDAYTLPATRATRMHF
jgi:hypothetical protein